MIFGRHINKYYLKYFPMILGGILALLLVDVFQLKIPELYRMVINGVESGSVELNGTAVPFDLDFLLRHVSIPMLFIVLVMVVGRFLWRVCLFGSAIKVETSIRGEMFERAKFLSQEYYQRNKVGNMMSLFTNDLETIQECFGDGMLMFFDALLLGTLAIIKMAQMSPWLTLMSLIPMSLLVAVGFIVGRYMRRKWEKRQEAFSALSDFSQENFSGIAVIKAFVKEFRELWAFRKLNKQNEDANVEHTRASTLLHILVTLFVESVLCIILGYGGYLVHTGFFNAGQLVEFISYFNSIVWPVMAISRLIEMRSRGAASLGRVGKLLDARPTVTDRPDVTEPPPIRGAIEFRSLTFRHPGADYNALTDVSFSIEAGESVGIIGRTGSGKTTVADLILRTYNVPDGTLFVDGIDVNSMPIRSLRNYISYVPQDNFLFSDTVGNNIAFASEEDGREAVAEAARLADVHDNIIGFSDGYDTLLGERGVTVSGGQKQRISIARALMRNSSILILDDSVSAVDTDTERTIIENLKACRGGRTTLLIAHRVSTVKDLDKIILLDEGRILAVGTHDELIAASPEYRRTVELQRLEDGGEPNA